MKKKLLLSFFIFTSVLTLFTQNWHLISLENRLNYRTAEEDLIENTIWIDSIQSTPETVIYSLNRRIECISSPDECYRNQPGLLGFEIQVEGATHRYGPNNSLSLLPNATLGTSWIYDSENGITAEITGLSETIFFGVVDSVKTIALSSMDTIRLSKRFGLYQFPNDNSLIDLVGVDNLHLGEVVPDFWDIYDFDVGDVFYYEKGWNSSAGNGSNRDGVYKYEVLNKIITDSSIVYDMHILGHYEQYDNTYIPVIVNVDDVFTVSFVRMPTPIEESYHRQLIQYAYEDSPTEDYGWFWTAMSFSRDEQGRWSKHIGYKTEMPSFGGHFDIYSEQDLLLHGVIVDEFHKTFQKGLGLTSYIFSLFETSEYSFMIGYIKGGMAVGEIIPDEDLIVSTKDILPIRSIQCFPNPADDKINFSLPSHLIASYPIGIYDISNNKLLEGIIENGSLSVATLPVGIYMLKIKTEEGVYISKMVKQ